MSVTTAVVVNVEERRNCRIAKVAPDSFAHHRSIPKGYEGIAAIPIWRHSRGNVVRSAHFHVGISASISRSNFERENTFAIRSKIDMAHRTHTAIWREFL
jgi:hypothetical protein